MYIDHRHYHRHHHASSESSKIHSRPTGNQHVPLYGDISSVLLCLLSPSRPGQERRERERDNEEKDSRRCSLSPLPSSDFQVAGSPPNRLPTLKELIGYQRTNEHRADDPVLLNLFPLKIDNEKRTNFILNGDGSFSNDTTVLDPRPWTLGEVDKNKEESLDENRAKDEVDLIVDKADSYYIEGNLADDDEDASFTSKKRIDRQDSIVALKPTTMRGIPLVDLLHDQVPRGFYVTKSELELRKPDEIENTEVTSVVETTIETRNTPDESETFSASTESVTTTFAPSILSTDSTSPPFSSASIESESSTNPVSIDSFVEESLNPNSLEYLRKVQSDTTTNSIATETESSTVFDDLNTEKQTDRDTTTVTTTTLPSTTVSKKQLNRRREKIDSDFGQRSRGRTRFKHREDSSKKTEDTQNPRRRVTIYRGRQRRPVSSSPATNYSKVKASNEDEGEQIEETTTLSSKESVTGNDRFEDEVNSSTNTPAHSPGSLLSTRLRKPAAFAPTSQQNKSSNTFTNHRKIRPTGGEHDLDGEKLDAADKTTDTPKVEKDIDQSSRAQEIAVTLAEPPTSQSSTTGRPTLRNAFRRKISTTIAPRTDATPTTTTTTTTKSRSSYRFTPIVGDRQKPRTKDKPVQNTTPRPKRPQVIDYDYYEDEEESVVGKSTYNEKLFLTSKGSIRCLDQGNFPHPYSCKKFITCARMVNGLVVGAEYTCPDKLSFDPVGGICNWSAGLGCND